LSKMATIVAGKVGRVSAGSQLFNERIMNKRELKYNSPARTRMTRTFSLTWDGWRGSVTKPAVEVATLAFPMYDPM
jgi:hypothetical protein